MTDVAHETDELELPRRPRRRLLNGGNPAALALLGALLIACGFIAGVHVEKHEGGSGAAAVGAAVASRFAAARVGASSTKARGGSAATTGAATTGGAAAGSPTTSSGGSRATTGTAADLDGNTLYVTGSEGEKVKVETSAATSVTKTVKAKVSGIHPGETVTVTGATGSSGAVSAESITVGSSDSGLAALLGGSGA
jgi:hypothetical protein